jgi:hypothetical protein
VKYDFVIINGTFNKTTRTTNFQLIIYTNVENMAIAIIELIKLTNEKKIPSILEEPVNLALSKRL